MPLLCCALFALAGGHFAVVQGVAWAGMLIDYSAETGSLLEGARKTFSGEAPCSLCESISKALSDESKKALAVELTKKIESVLPLARLEVGTVKVRGRKYLLPPDSSADPRSDQPPTPIPIS